MMRDYRWLVLVIASLIVTSTEIALGGTSHPDSIRVYGTWRWIESTGGFGAVVDPRSPENCGYERLLVMKPSGMYEFVEQDSTHEYLLCQGAVTIHTERGLVAEPGWRADFWLSFEAWWQGFEQDQLILFEGRDTLLTYPGSSKHGVSDGVSHRFVRVTKTTKPDSARRALARLPLGDRPRRSDPSDLPAEGQFVYYEEVPVLVTRVEPMDPKMTRDPNRAPVVTLHVLVGKDGLVKNVKVIRGVTGYNVPAVEAVKKWIYKPALSNNNPVAVWIEVPVRFGP